MLALALIVVVIGGAGFSRLAELNTNPDLAFSIPDSLEVDVLSIRLFLSSSDPLLLYLHFFRLLCHFSSI